ncbi:MAG: hypothetical protein JHC63_09080 [Acidimicrobiia bacterium]|nr:hypothetical protein [Acidimicrobiia bacterium]
MTHSTYRPTHEFSALRVGDISLDRVAIVGANQMLFLYEGSNDHYRSYSKFRKSQLIETGREWANLTAQRQSKSSDSLQVLSLFVPNPASCMPDLYPLPLPVCPTAAWTEMRRLLADDSGVLFCDELFTASLPENRSAANPWLRTDSHWSEFGSLIVVNAILDRLGVSPIMAQSVSTEPFFLSGDLGYRFGDEVGVSVMGSLFVDLPTPSCVYDSGNGSMDGASMGRRVEWRCPDAPLPSSLVVVGNSFAGTGLSRNHLTYWLSRVFQRTVFLHGASVPTDVVETYQPDILLFQGLERFFGIVPVDAYTTEECERIYVPPTV